MADYFKQVREAAERGGASEPFNYAMDRIPSVPEAAGGGAYMGAKYLAPETVDYTKQLIDAAKEQYLEPARQQFNEMLPTGVTMSGSPSLTDPTLTPRLDLSEIGRAHV